MGIFDNRLVSNFIPKSFFPKGEIPSPGDKYVSQQQSGCGVKVYPNSDSRSVRHLYWEIQSATVERTTVDIGGGFTITLAPTEPWDEIIMGDDFVRIFMGDQIMRGFLGPDGYNFGSGSLDQSQARARTDIVSVPVPETGFTYSEGGGVRYGNRKPQNYLVMYERMVGKVDRVQKVEEAMGGPDDGYSVSYVVTGRTLGSIIQDTALYYNEWLPGLNAINIFFGSNLELIQSPSEFVRDILSVVLSAVPLPQWQLPKSLVDDLNFGNIAAENAELASKNLNAFKQRISSGIGQNPVSGLANALTELNKLVKEIDNNGNNNPFNVMSTKSFKETTGSTLNKSFLSSQSNGLLDMVKHLSNDAFNEFYFDLCPGGVVDGGSLSSSIGVPSLVMRQRPYDITEDMLSNVSTFLEGNRDKLSRFGRAKDDVDIASLTSASKSLSELDNNSITIYSREQQADVNKYLQDISKISSSKSFFIPGGTAIPTCLKNETGYSNHDRLNAFLVLGQYNRGHQNQTDRILMSENGGFKIDPESIKRYGFRIMELSTIYAQPDDKKNAQSNFGELLKGFSSLIANWYFMNHNFLNGRIVCRFLPEARLGIPVKYYQTKVTPYNPYPKMEMSYCQGVTDSYQYGQPLTTTLTVIRGIRYNLLAANNEGLKDEINKLVQANERIRNTFGGVVV